MKKYLAIFLVFTLVLFRYRQVFAYHYDPVYWEKFYNESQYSLGSRELSDEGYYRYTGYRLVNNSENPMTFAYQVPPFGKYLYGLTAKYFNNPYLTSLILYVFYCLIFYFLAKELLPSALVVLASLLFAINPLFVSQIRLTMLDLPLAFLLLCYLLSFVKYLKDTENYKYLLASAIFLGLSAGTKAAFYPAVILIFSSVCLVHLKKTRLIPAIFIFMFLGYVLAYFSYFTQHPNPIPWLRLHQNILEFQLAQKGTAFHFNPFQAIFLQSTKHYDGRNYPFQEWYLLLPLFFLSLFKIFIQKTNQVEKYLIIFTFTYLLSSSFLDFWPRYFVPILAPLTIIFVSTVKNKYLLSLAILYSLILLYAAKLQQLQ